VTDLLARLRLDYRSAFIGYLSRRGEAQLSSAYEIGRQAIAAGIGLLELVQVHNAVTLDLLRSAAGEADRLDVAEAAGAFLVEVLAASEMTQRGFLESTRDPGGDD
jgi:hypothetical protein